jgi:hypothetical protein
LSSEKLELVLDEILGDSESRFLDSDDDSNGINDLPVGEAIAVERMENEDSDSAQDESGVQGVPSADMFTWEDMKNYIGQREQFVGNCGPQNEAKNDTESADIFKMVFAH